jgi:hypothetical protein
VTILFDGTPEAWAKAEPVALEAPDDPIGADWKRVLMTLPKEDRRDPEKVAEAKRRWAASQGRA